VPTLTVSIKARVRHIWLSRITRKLGRNERKRKNKNVKGEGKNTENDSLFGDRKKGDCRRSAGGETLFSPLSERKEEYKIQNMIFSFSVKSRTGEKGSK
jgi:hypothetical protein